MKFSAALISYVLFTTSALAVPHGSTLEQRQARRALARKSRLPQYEKIEGAEANGNETQVSYSTNWSGAVLTAPPAGQTFNAVSASFVVPTPKVPSGSSSRGTYAASAWVGIDGDTYQNAILQTGVDFTISNGRVSYDAWYEWFPDYAYDFSLDVNAGDTVTVSVTSSSATSGTAVIVNQSTGQRVSKSLTAPESSARLGGQNAEWIVEDFEQGGSLVNLVNFGSVTFTGATAKTASTTENASGAEIIDIRSGGTVYTSVTDNGDSVTVTYV
ncbi:peptidase A4 family-domain-containing protein [Xylogone sp. PMI_703]|nr:peptidase A4 family-domain-containing protein [Xylogone sp. PMI_703]